MAAIGVQSRSGLWHALEILPFICRLAGNSQRRSHKCDSLQPLIGLTRAIRYPPWAATSPWASNSCPAPDSPHAAPPALPPPSNPPTPPPPPPPPTALR